MRIKGEIDELTLAAVTDEVGWYGYVLNNLPLLFLQQDRAVYMYTGLSDTIRWVESRDAVPGKIGLCLNTEWLATVGEVCQLPALDHNGLIGRFVTHPSWRDIHDAVRECSVIPTCTSALTVLELSRRDWIRTEVYFAGARREGYHIIIIGNNEIRATANASYPPHPIPVVR